MHLRKNTKIELLRRMPLFAQFSGRELGEVASVADAESPPHVVVAPESPRLPPEHERLMASLLRPYIAVPALGALGGLLVPALIYLGGQSAQAATSASLIVVAAIDRPRRARRL